MCPSLRAARSVARCLVTSSAEALAAGLEAGDALPPAELALPAEGRHIALVFPVPHTAVLRAVVTTDGGTILGAPADLPPIDLARDVQIENDHEYSNDTIATAERLYYEQFCELGDVLIYDTRVLHGVTEIDLRRPFRQDSLAGRLAGFVTLYRDLSESRAS